MEKEMVKEAVKSAEEELKNEEKTKIKSVVKATLELLRKKEEQRKILDDEIRILKKDVEDFRAGRIDHIKERQDLDPKAKEVSVVIIKEKIIERTTPVYPMWYFPWVIEVKPQYVPYIPIYCGTCDATVNNSWTLTNDANSSVSFTTTNSAAHMHTSGTYQLTDGTIKYV